MCASQYSTREMAWGKRRAHAASCAEALQPIGAACAHPALFQTLHDPTQPFDMATACSRLGRAASPMLQRASGSLAASPLAQPRRAYRTGRHSSQQQIVSMARKGLSELLSLGKK